MQVHQGASHARPRSQFSRIDVARSRPTPDTQELLGRRSLTLKLLEVRCVQADQNLFLFVRRRSGQRPLKCILELGRHIPSVPGNQLRKAASCLDISRIVEQYQRLQRGIGSRALCGALLAIRSIKNEQTRVQVLTLPVRIKTPSIKLLPCPVLPFSLREI